MSKHTKDLFEKASRFSIRKYKVGVFSVLIGSLFLGIVTTSDTAFAASESAEEISQQVSGGISETRTVSPILETTSQTASESVSIENKGEDRAGEAATGVQETVTEREIGNQTPQATDRLTVVTSSSLEKDQNYYEASKFDSDKVLEVTNVTTQNKTNKTIDLSSDLNKVKSLNSATIYMEFKPEEGQTGLYTLFSASSSTNRDSYYAVGIQNGNTPFVEARKSGVQQYGSLLRKGTINTNEWNSLAVTMNQTDTGAGRIDIYLNGQYAFHSSRSGKFISDFTDLTHMQLGAMRRGTSMTWGANVNFRNFTIYDRSLNATEVAERSKIFDKLPSDVVDKDGQVLTDGEIVLNKNAYSPTAGFRIPTLLKTADGTLIAGADRRIATMADQGDIEMMVRLSQDNGETWGDKIPIFNIRNSPVASRTTQPASMDMALVQDPETGKVFAFYDLFIEGRALRGLPTTPEKGYKMVDGKNYQRLYRNSDKAEFTIRENGVVYDANNQATNYRVILTPSKGANNDYDTYGDIYEGNSRLGNIYFSTNSLFTVPNTSYILMSESSDSGKTWSAPRNISDMVRTDDMEFLGIGPGTAIVLKEGKHAGRIVVPTYSRGSVTKLESARVMYSDDHGATWKSGEAANDGRIVANGTTIQSKDFRDGSYQNSEATVVQLKNGQLKMFMRNRSGTVQIATSNDGGATWEDSIESTKIPEETTQMSAITTIQDGKEYVILVNGGTPRRINGYAHVAEVKDNGLLEWKETHLIQKGQFAYNSIQQLSDTEFGLLYEHDDATSGNMYYKTMNWEFLKPKEQKEIVVSVVSSSLTNQSDVIAFTFDDNVVASHDLILKLSNGKNLPLLAQYDTKTLLFKWDRSTDSNAEVTGVVSGTLDSLKNYKINEKATLPHNLNGLISRENIAFDTYYKGDENLDFGLERTEAGTLGKKLTNNTYYVNSQGQVIERSVISVTPPLSRVRVKGTKPTVTTISTELPLVYQADSNLAYGQTVRISGNPKIETLTTTYEVHADDGTITPTTTSVVSQEGSSPIFNIGTQPTQKTQELAFETEFVADENLAYGQSSEIAGVTGVKTITTTYKLEGDKAVVDSTSDQVTTAAQNRLVKIGTKPSVVTKEIAFTTTYEADDSLALNEQQVKIAGVLGSEIMTTTYKLDGDHAVVDKVNTQIINPTIQVIKVGTRPTTQETKIESPIRYEAKADKDFGSANETVLGETGVSTVTTSYTVDPTTGEVTATAGAPVITKPATATVIYVGTKPTVTTEFVPFSTDYLAAADLAFGERQETAGQNGVETTTTTYKIENGRAVQDKVTTVQSQAPVNKQVKIGNVKVETTTTNPETVYEADSSLAYGATAVASEGKAGQTVTTTTYQVDTSGNLVNGVETVTTTPAENRVIRIGNIQTSTSPIALETVYEDDPDNFTTSEIVMTAGQAGEETTTLTYQVNPATGALTNPVTSSVTSKEMVKRVIKRGTLAVVAATENELPAVEETTSTESVDLPFTTRYEADETLNYGVREVRVSGQAGKQTTTRHTATLNGEVVAQREEVTSTTPAVEEVIVLGTKPKTETVSIASPVRYEADAAKDFGSTNETVPGQDGESTVTTMYTVNPTTGEVTATVGEALVTKEPTETIVKIGTRPTVITETVPFSTDYVADENLAYGEQSETAGVVGEKTITTTYTVNTDGTVTAHVGEPVQTKAPVTKVVKIGTKSETTTIDVDYTTSYVADDTLDYGKTTVRTPGVKGQATTTTTYKLDGNKAVVDKTTTTQTMAPTAEVIAVGTKATTTTADVEYITSYVADDTLDYGKTTVRTPGVKGQATTTTTYKLDGDHAVVDKVDTQTTNPTEQVISVGTKPTIQETEIVSLVRYEAKADKDFGSANETVSGETGVSTVTTTYTVNPTTGEVTATVGDPVITKPAKATVVYVGTKPSVTTASVPFSTEYVSDETLAYGETSETTGVVGTKTITTTYKLDGDKAVVEATSEEVTTPAQNRVIRVGNVQTITAPITIETVYEDDPANFTTSEIVVTEGQAGGSSITTAYAINPSTGTLENPQSQISIVQEMKPRVIKRGTLAVVAETENELPAVEETSREEVTETPYTTIYRDDDSLYLGINRILVQGQNGKRVVIHTQASLNGQVVAEKDEVIQETPVVDEVILRGTKSVQGRETVIAYEEIEPAIVYREDGSLLKGQTRTEQGIAGKRKVTRVYETIRGVRTNTILESSETVIEQVQPTIIYLGTKVISEVPSVAPIQPELPELNIRREKIQEEILVRFTKKEIKDSTLPAGTRKVIVAGRDGKMLRTIISDYAGQELVYTNSYDEMLEEVVTEIVAVGMKEPANLTESPAKPVESAKELITAPQTQSRNRLPETGSEDEAILTSLGLLGLMSGLGLTFKKRKE